MGNNCSCNKNEEGNEQLDLGRSAEDINNEFHSVTKKLETGASKKEDLFNKNVNPNELEKEITEHGPKHSARAKMLMGEPPNHNSVVEHVLRSVGEVELPPQKKEDINLPYLPPFELDFGSVYVGQWKEGGRHGRGRQTWRDG